MEEAAVPSAAALNKENTCPQGQTQEKRRSVVVGSAKKKFPEGESYELLLMEIVDKNNAHIPPKGGIGKYWTKVVADFNATTWPSVDKLSDWRPFQRKYIGIRSNVDQFHESVARGTANKDNLSEMMSKAYGIAYDHALEEADATDAEVAAKLMAEHDATKQVAEGRALRLKSASSIVAGKQFSAKKINKRGNSDAAGTSSNKALCRDLIDSLTKTRQGNAEIEAKRFDFEKQMVEQRFEMEKQESLRKHELQLQGMDLQKMQMDMQMAERKIRLAQLEQQGGDRKDSSK